MNDISSGQPHAIGGSASFMHGASAVTQSSGPKFPTSIDVKFDINNSESLLKGHALKEYQENAYLLGQIFSIRERNEAKDPSIIAGPDETTTTDADGSSSDSDVDDDEEEGEDEIIDDKELQMLRKTLEIVRGKFEKKLDQQSGIYHKFTDE